jgi:hypothetical protein
MCHARNRLKWEDGVDAILPAAGALSALVILVILLIILAT